MGQLGWEEVCVLKAQIIIDGAMVNNVGLILNVGRCAQQTCALMAGGLDGLWQVAFPFNAKMVAACPKSTEGNAVLVVCDLEQVGGGQVQGQVGADVL